MQNLSNYYYPFAVFHVRFTWSFNQESSLKKLQPPAHNRQHATSNIKFVGWKQGEILNTDSIQDLIVSMISNVTRFEMSSKFRKSNYRKLYSPKVVAK